MDEPTIVKSIPIQIINEGAAYGPFDIKNFFDSPDKSPLKFSAQTYEGDALPKGMICTEDGFLTGIPAKGTEGNYEVVITAANEHGKVESNFLLVIKPSLAASQYADKLKSQIWDALEKNMPIPDLGEMLQQPITILEIYYLLERWGIITMWDAFNLEPPGGKTLLTLEGASEHYNIYDRGSCIVAAPKDLFSHERTLEDGLRTARAMAKEVYKRNWTVELTGFDKLTRAAWVEFQRLSNVHGRKIEVINFSPTPDDLKIYTSQMLGGGPEI